MVGSRVVGIVADDLTGAIDTSGGFAARGLHTILSLTGSHQRYEQDCQVLCYNTQTRNARSSDVGRSVGRAARLLFRDGYPRLYKKIDSTLRGHIGAEIVIMLKESHAPYALVAPAFPQMGRTQRGGVLYVGDLPLDRTTEARDPLAGMGSSSVVQLLEQQTGLRAGLVDLATVESGEPAIDARTAVLLAEGCTLVAYDSLSAGHLARIEAVLARSYPRGLLVGSAGLASAMAARLVPGSGSQQRPPRIEAGAQRVVLASGSLSQTTSEQIERVRGVPDVRTVTMDVPSVLGSVIGRDSERGRVRREMLVGLSRRQDICLMWRDPSLGGISRVPRERLLQRGRRLNMFLRELMRGIFVDMKISGLVLVGGDTAHSVLSGLRAEAIRLQTEVLPGISMGTVLGGDVHSKFLVTKAGGFGAPDALVRVMEYVRGGRMEQA